MRWLLLLAVLSCASAQTRDFQIEAAPKRKALVIGNNKYPKQPLANAVNDATDLAASLKKIGFDTRLLLDADLRAMDVAAREFAQGLRPGDVALFYFSGHGISLEGENFLLPVSFAAEMESDVRYQALSASRVRDLLKGQNIRLSILIFDACRSNPFRGTRSGGGGLSGMSGAGAFIAFAADEGKTADDNPKERNGLFTKHLLAELEKPGVGLEQLFTRVRTKVYEESGGKQIPFSYSGLIGEFLFLEPPPPPPPPTPAPAPITEAKPKPEVKAEPAAKEPVAAPAPVIPKREEPPAPLPQPGEKRTLSRDGSVYVFVPPAQGIIGCVPASDCQEGDLPGRAVQTTTGFWIGETEVTRDAYLRVMGKAPSLRFDAHKSMAAIMQGRLPVSDISAVEAQSYCAQVGLRLPTEFEWEFAARAGLQINQPTPLSDFAWTSPQEARSVEQLVRMGVYARAVAQKQPNAWGIYDMLGNLGEFTLNAADQSKIVVRGGSFIQTADKVRFPRRYELPKNDEPYMNFGFRCAGQVLPK